MCNEIDGLPFTTEGYARAKNILKTNHGNTSEIVRAYITNIQELPTITGRTINMIYGFIKTLNYNVQSLETLGKLSQCLSMVRGILEKLPGIKAELVTNQVGGGARLGVYRVVRCTRKLESNTSFGKLICI